MNELESHLWQATDVRRAADIQCVCVCFALISMFKETNMEIADLETCFKKCKAC